MSLPKRVGIVVFPGSNCDHDAYHVCKHVIGADTKFLWHDATELDDREVIILPGGFSYGDYLRAGSISRFSPIMNAVIKHASAGGLVVGICNGFQILCECGLLPGALCRNEVGEFRCQWVNLRVERNDLSATKLYSIGQVVRYPIAHGEGRYVLPEDELAKLEAAGQIVFRYCDAKGNSDWSSTDKPDYNPNGSISSV